MTDTHTETFVLQEFRLSAVDTDGTVARIVAATSSGSAAAVPLLTSIEDRHDVAVVERMRDGDVPDPDQARRALLDPFVTSWQRTKRYIPRIAEQSLSPPTHYRLAVTESGINEPNRQAATPMPRAQAREGPTAPLDLLWIGRPDTTHAGLLILLGDQGTDPSVQHGGWPLPLSTRLGVRIYDSGS